MHCSCIACDWTECNVLAVQHRAELLHRYLPLSMEHLLNTHTQQFKLCWNIYIINILHYLLLFLKWFLLLLFLRSGSSEQFSELFRLITKHILSLRTKMLLLISFKDTANNCVWHLTLSLSLCLYACSWCSCYCVICCWWRAPVYGESSRFVLQRPLSKARLRPLLLPSCRASSRTWALCANLPTASDPPCVG